MCKWPAVNGVVMHAIKAGKYTDEEIHAALLRMAKSGHSVTVDALRIELEGLAPRGRHTSTRQDETDRLFTDAAQRIAARKELGQ